MEKCRLSVAGCCCNRDAFWIFQALFKCLLLDDSSFFFSTNQTLKRNWFSKQNNNSARTSCFLVCSLSIYLDTMVAQPRHEILQCDVFMEERTHDFSFPFDTSQSVLGCQILGKPSEHKTRFSHHLIFYCITHYCLGALNRLDITMRLPLKYRTMAPLKNSPKLTKFGELDFSIARNSLIQHEYFY